MKLKRVTITAKIPMYRLMAMKPRPSYIMLFYDNHSLTDKKDSIVLMNIYIMGGYRTSHG